MRLEKSIKQTIESQSLSFSQARHVSAGFTGFRKVRSLSEKAEENASEGRGVLAGG